MNFRRLLLTATFLVMSSNLFSMLPLPSECVKFPPAFRNATLLYSVSSGFYIDTGNDFFPVGDTFVVSELYRISSRDLLVKLGRMWMVNYKGHTFLVSKFSPSSCIRDLMSGMNEIPGDVKKAIADAMPKPRKLEVYFQCTNKLGIRIIDEEQS